jgi:alkanesulfonate monooxygenase SsuD/methylene tetrahydromethanopterin reductase-like flavin-dependent oxidoreductase (luciferase family)
MWPPDTAWPDSWVLIGAMAGLTRRLRFSNAVYVAPARPLLEVVKQVATASVVSQGRVSLAVGVGWMREEFELMGQDFDTRGKRLNEMIPAMRALWRGGWVSWSGDHYQVPELMIEPHPEAPCPSCAGVNPTRRFGVRHGYVTAGSATRTPGTTPSVTCRSWPRCADITDARTNRSRSCLRCSNHRHRICTSAPRTSASPR